MSKQTTPACGKDHACLQPDAHRTIEQYIAGSDNDRNRIEADHPNLITDDIRRRAAATRKGPERTWTGVGSRYTTAKRRPDILRAIASLEWQDATGQDAVELPMMAGLAIKTFMKEMRMPPVSRLAWHGANNTLCWRDGHGKAQHYSLYGIEAMYGNVRVRVYIIDVGTATVPLASDLWPLPAPQSPSQTDDSRRSGNTPAVQRRR
jgi:hypothetical protein